MLDVKRKTLDVYTKYTFRDSTSGRFISEAEVQRRIKEGSNEVIRIEKYPKLYAEGNCPNYTLVMIATIWSIILGA